MVLSGLISPGYLQLQWRVNIVESMATMERALLALLFCIGALALSAWISAPPRRTETPSPLPTDVAALCAEARGNGAPDVVASLAAAPNVPSLLALAGGEYGADPTPAGLQRLQAMCP